CLTLDQKGVTTQLSKKIAFKPIHGNALNKHLQDKVLSDALRAYESIGGNVFRIGKGDEPSSGVCVMMKLIKPCQNLRILMVVCIMRDEIKTLLPHQTSKSISIHYQ